MKRTDSNQKQIVRQLRQIGCSVAVLSSVGKGFPDLLIGFKNTNILVELKDGNKFKSQQKLTPDEIEFHNSWRGQIATCNCIDDILKLL